MPRSISGRRSALAAAAATTLLAVPAAITLAANPASTTTATGQQLNVHITAPADGATYPAGTTSVPLTGSVNVGDVPTTGEAHVAVLLDESGSLGNADFATEKAAANELHRDLEAIQGLNVFSSATFFSGVATTVHPDAPVHTDVAPANGIPDFRDKVSARVRAGGSTFFDAAINAALAQLNGKPGTKLIFMVSDGQPSSGHDVNAGQIATLQSQSIAVHTYALGTSVVSCEHPNSRLKALADATGGTCTTVANPADLDAALTGTDPAGIDAVESRANNNPFAPVDTLTAIGSVQDVVDGLLPGTNTIELQATAGDEAETQATADVTITVERPLVTVADAQRDEDEAVLTHEVTLASPAVDEVTARIRTSDGTASSPADYDALDTTVTFAPGETSTTVDVQLHEDAVDEPDETYAIEASEVTLGGSGGPAATGTIIDDDEPALSIGDAEELEGNPGDDVRLQHTVALSNASTNEITTGVALFDGTAVTGQDMEPLASTSVTFAPGETSRTVEVAVLEDLDGEPDETYTVRLLAGDHPVADGEATGTIRNDDRLGTFTCRASTLRVLGIEPIVANPPGTPCAAQSRGLLRLSSLTLGSITLNGGAGDAVTTTNVGPEPQTGEQVSAASKVVGLVLKIGWTTVTVDVLESSVTTTCGDGDTPGTTTAGQVVGLRINGKPTTVGDKPMTIPLGLASIRLNAVSTPNGITTRRALEVTGLVNLVIAESQAGSSGLACTAATPAP